MTFSARISPRLSALGLTFALMSSVATAQAAADRVVALVVSSEGGAARADAVQSQLDRLGAETLRSTAPNNAQLRSMMRRFANEARDARTTLVYIDMLAVRFDGRDYVVPEVDFVQPSAGRPERPTDIFTHTIPLQAFARMAAQAEDSGAVILALDGQEIALPARLTPLAAAPDPVAGAASISVVSPEHVDAAIDAIARAQAPLAIPALVEDLARVEGVSVSFIPEPVVVELPVEEVIEARVETEEELALLEKSLSRAAKRDIQQGLRELGHYSGLVDGVIGPQTREAIIAFQAARDEAETGLLTRRQLLDLTTRG